jgi:hypothetical protein
MFIMKKRAYICKPKIVERLVFWAMSGMTLTGKKPVNVPFEQFESSWYMYTDIKSFLEDARCQDIGGFFSAIRPEIEQLQTALFNLSAKVREKSILFLDADGNLFPEFVSYDNPSSDAD